MEAYPTVKEKKGSMKDMLKKKESTHENAIHQIHEDNPKHKEKHPDHWARGANARERYRQQTNTFHEDPVEEFPIRHLTNNQEEVLRAYTPCHKNQEIIETTEGDACP